MTRVAGVDSFSKYFWQLRYFYFEFLWFSKLWHRHLSINSKYTFSCQLLSAGRSSYAHLEIVLNIYLSSYILFWQNCCWNSPTFANAPKYMPNLSWAGEIDILIKAKRILILSLTSCLIRLTARIEPSMHIAPPNAKLQPERESFQDCAAWVCTFSNYFCSPSYYENREGLGNLLVEYGHTKQYQIECLYLIIGIEDATLASMLSV